MTAKESPAAPQTDLRNALEQYANRANWLKNDDNVARIWNEPDTETPEAYHGYELAEKALAAAPALPVTIPKDERFSFELAARKGLPHTITGIDFRRDDDGDYQWAVTRRLYEFWQEARRTASVASGAMEPQQEHVSASPARSEAMEELLRDLYNDEGGRRLAKLRRAIEQFESATPPATAEQSMPGAARHVPVEARILTKTYDREEHTVTFKCSECKKEHRDSPDLVGADQWFMCDGDEFFLRVGIGKFTDLVKVDTAGIAQPVAPHDTDEPSEREALIACLGDDAVQLDSCELWPEMAQTMREAAAMLEADEVEMAILGLAASSPLTAPVAVSEDQRDAARYRHMRNRENSLETLQRDKGIVNGPSCYHQVEGIWELKHGVELDAAIDAAQRATPTGQSNQTKGEQ